MLAVFLVNKFKLAENEICLAHGSAADLFAALGRIAMHRQTMVRCIDVSKIEMLLIMLVSMNLRMLSPCSKNLKSMIFVNENGIYLVGALGS